MARNLREGSLGQVNVRAANDVVGGTVVTEGGFTGVAVTDAAAGEVVALDLSLPYDGNLGGLGGGFGVRNRERSNQARDDDGDTKPRYVQCPPPNLF